MSTTNEEARPVVQTTPRVSLPIAVTLVVLFTLPFAFFLGKFNIPAWVCFIVWAEYFQYGATPSNWRVMIPSLAFGAAAGCAWSSAAVYLGTLGISAFWAWFLSAIVFIWLYLKIHVSVPTFMEGSLASFNGFTLYLAVYFTNSIPKVGLVANPAWVLTMAFIWTVILAYFGWFLGWLNIILTFPKQVEKKK